MITEGYVVAEELENGSPGRPIGNDDGSVALFDNLECARGVLEAVVKESGTVQKLCVFRANVSFAGKVVLV
jgi:hypothetical protein